LERYSLFTTSAEPYTCGFAHQRAMWTLFAEMPGLKVNFNKSMLGINIPESWLIEAASILNCKVGKVPFLYLGISIGGDPRRLAFWDPVLKSIKFRLSGWQSRFLSFGGRLVLLKSALTSMHVYALSFFKAPSGIISIIESIFNQKNWGGSEENRKISWVAWSSICLCKEYEGLGVRQLREFNSALLGKWCWRMLVDRDGFWYRVLAAQYGEEARRLEVGGRSGSFWWKELVKIRDGLRVVDGGWFTERVSKRMGDGSSTFFWYDRWLGDVPLRTRFSRLFDLATNKMCTVVDMCALGWEVGGEAWCWRRRLWVWEEELVVECSHLVNNVVLHTDVLDRWQWDLNIVGGYIVNDAYHILTAQTDPSDVGLNDLVWHKQVPLKVSSFAWRLLRDRLPTKLNLVRQGLLTAAAARCIAGCGHDESVTHLFLHCDTFGLLCQNIRSWIGVEGVEPYEISDHFFQFTHYTGSSKKRTSFLQLIWLLCVWVVWNDRNNIVFNKTQTTIDELLEKVKFHSFWWRKANNANYLYGSQRWWSDPLLCLGID